MLTVFVAGACTAGRVPPGPGETSAAPSTTDHQDWSDQLAGVGQPNAFGFNAAGEIYVATDNG